MHRLALLTLIVSLVSLDTAHSAQLELPGGWYRITEPWRYDETRRFEDGWNRGADVVAADGVARAPIAGRVRFAGDVAGRRVVTVQSVLDGVPVVVTFTGLDGVRVRVGDQLRAGDAVGTGAALHVGAYDQRRRTRYLPVVTGGAAAAARGDATMSGVIAGRLLDAIEGRAGMFAPRVRAPLTGTPWASRRGVGASRASSAPSPWSPVRVLAAALDAATGGALDASTGATDGGRSSGADRQRMAD